MGISSDLFCLLKFAALEPKYIFNLYTEEFGWEATAGVLQLLLIKHIIVSVLPCASPSVCIYSVTRLPLSHALSGIGTILSLSLYSAKYNRAPNLHPNRGDGTSETSHVVEGNYFQFFHVIDLLGELLGRCLC